VNRLVGSPRLLQVHQRIVASGSPPPSPPPASLQAAVLKSFIQYFSIFSASGQQKKGIFLF